MTTAGNMLMLSGSKSSEDEMYKELLLKLVQLPVDGETFEFSSDAVTNIRSNLFYNWKWRLNAAQTSTVSSNMTLSVNLPNCVTIGTTSFGSVFLDCNLVSVSMPALKHCYGGNNFQRTLCTSLELPQLENFANHEFSYSSTLKTLNLPSVTSKNGSFFVYQCSALEHVYIPQMTLSQLGGASYIAQQACNSAAVFHLKDGDYNYQGQPIS